MIVEVIPIRKSLRCSADEALFGIYGRNPDAGRKRALTEHIPRPEHPRPDAERVEWLNLNGVWEFAETDDSADERYLADKPYPDKITVPFCRESRLSGLARLGFVKNVWYRRTFDLPEDWRSPRVLLHVGASDWKTRVWLNGHALGEHIGGSTPFEFEVSEHLKPRGNTVVVHAFDDTRSGVQALGKQCWQEENFSCLYTRTTGIWQTVWLEGVGGSYVRYFRVDPDPDNSHVIVSAEIDGGGRDLMIEAVAYAGEKVVAEAVTPADWRNPKLVLDLSEKRLWSVDDPFLYDLKLTLRRGGEVVDHVESYFGLRGITIQGAAILLNGKPVFQRLVLNQGFYPDGIWTAPSDEALRRDIELSKAAGFNGARLHMKVFEPRFLYWADKLGYLGWGEFPCWGLEYTKPEVNLPMMREWAEVIRRDRNHPCIILWCPFAETCEEAVPLQNAVVSLTRDLDPSRPIIDASAWVHGLPDLEILDVHDFDQDTSAFREKWSKKESAIPFMVSDYGGIGWDI